MVVGDKEEGRPANLATLFNVASLTKPVFAQAVLALVDRGEFDLDESLSPHWIDPDVADDPRNRSLTARWVLSHQTGFPNWRDGRKLQFAFTPGEGVGYSGEGFDYLRRSLEKKTGREMASLVAGTVLIPFGMSDTHFVWNPSFDARFAREHDREGRRIAVPPKLSPSAADDLITTIGDYGRFVAALSRGGGLSSRLFGEVCTIQVRKSAVGLSGGPADYGLGWRVITNAHGPALMHGGSDQGVRTGVVVVPSARAGVVVFTNGDNGGRIIEAVVPKVLPNGGESLATFAGSSPSRR